jgi:23S rRNA (uracil1939-C5)-methyltransferase
MNKLFKLKIETQGFQGYGIGHYLGKKVFVPYAVIEDILEVMQISENNKFIKAEIINIITPSQYRANPSCKYFTMCGGCDMQHMRDDLYKKTKLDHIESSLSRSGFDVKEVSFIDFPIKSRRKIKVHIHNNKVGFYHKNSHDIVEIDSCEVIESNLLKEIGTLRDCGKRILKDEELVLTDGGLIKIGNYQIRYNNYFIQACAETNEIVADLIRSNLPKDARLIDLFAGVGAYSLLLHPYLVFSHAFDGDQKVVEPLNEAIEKYKINNIVFNLKDLFKNPISQKVLNKYNVAIINPPKNGAEPQFKEIAKSNINEIHVISCNISSLERDLKYLAQAGFTIKSAKLLDQFKWSYHSELYLYLVK